jgi:hypothetical protein
MKFKLGQNEVELAVSEDFTTNYQKLLGDASLEKQLDSLSLDGIKVDISEELLPLFAAFVEGDCVDKVVSFEQYLRLKEAILQVFDSQSAAV